MNQDRIIQATVLERSCGVLGKDWMRIAPALNGLERLKARFHGYAYDWHRHDSYAVGVTLEGVQTFDYRRATHNSLPGQVIVIHPDERHNGRAGSTAGLGYCMVYIEPSRIREAVELPRLPFVPETIFSDRSLARTILAAFRSFPQPLPELESDAFIARISNQLVRRSDEQQKQRVLTAAKARMQTVRDFLDAEFNRPVESQELEALTGLSRYAIARHFRVCYGTSPYRYLLMRRLAEARRRIVQGTPIVDVAIDLGFADQSHLTRCLHQMFGLPPGKLRQLALGSLPNSK
jgi:AraC-like DNA-binding protein